MSTIVTAAIVILGTIGITILFIIANKRNHRRRHHALLSFFKQSGTETGLAFSSQEVLKSTIIGLDGLHQTLSVFKFLHSDKVMHLRLADIKACTLRKDYEIIHFGKDGSGDTERQLRSILLEFTFINGREAVPVLFYDRNFDTIYEMAELEAKAKNWETILNKIIYKEPERPPVLARR